MARTQDMETGMDCNFHLFLFGRQLFHSAFSNCGQRICHVGSSEPSKSGLALAPLPSAATGLYCQQFIGLRGNYTTATDKTSREFSGRSDRDLSRRAAGHSSASSRSGGATNDGQTRRAAVK